MKDLWLFTRQYPLGRGEAFLTDAIKVWRAHFRSIRVIPMYEGPGRVDLPSGVEETRLWSGADCFAHDGSPTGLWKALPLLARRGDGWWHRRNAPEAVSHARQLVHKAAVLQRELMPFFDPERTVVLCAWLEDWVNVLGLLRHHAPGLRINAMAHGWDLFEERRTAGAIPYRAWQMDVVDRVYCIAASGRAHLARRFPLHAAKLRLAPLGVPDRGMAPLPEGEVLHVVSCAHLRPPKRFDVIAEALMHVRRPVRWTVIGDGPQRPALEAAAARLPGHVRTEFAGHMAHDMLMRWYASYPVDLLLHWSDHEGVPVALMEAASFGVALVANDAGGTSEVVGDATGHLFPATASPMDLAELIDGEMPMRWRHTDHRQGVRTYCLKHFNAATNLERLATDLCAVDRTVG
jgi:glycosyltransferase involved in cell wall biosynthesis